VTNKKVSSRSKAIKEMKRIQNLNKIIILGLGLILKKFLPIFLVAYMD
jgi:hypothetical protein